MKRRVLGRFLFVAVYSAAIAFGCSLFGSNPENPENSATVKLNIASIGDEYRGTRSIDSSARGVLEQGGSVVDGLRLWVNGVMVYNTETGQGTPIWASPDGSGGTLLDLRSDGDISRLTDDASVPLGTYDLIRLEFQDKLEIKAKTQVGSISYYTTATGIVGESSVDPAKYDFYFYPFYALSGDPYSDAVPALAEVNVPEFITVDGTVQYRLDILVDFIALANFWNGEGTPTVEPFKNGCNPQYTMDEFYPSGQAHFGMASLPVAMALTDLNDSTIDVTMETYGVYPESMGDITDDNATDLTFLTISYLNATTKVPYWAYLRNWTADLTGLMPFFSDFELNASQTGFNAYSVCPGQGYSLIRDFPRLTPGEKSTFTADCYDENGQMTQSGGYIVKRLQ